MIGVYVSTQRRRIVAILLQWWMIRRLIHHRGLRLLVVSSVRRIIGGFNSLEPLHADGVDLGDLVLEGGPFDLIFYLAIPENAFQGDELPLLESLGELREIPPGIDAVPFGAGSLPSERSGSGVRGRSAAEVCTSEARKIRVPLVARQGRSPSGGMVSLLGKERRKMLCSSGEGCGRESTESKAYDRLGRLLGLRGSTRL
jgi:hypothetical protein